jgi:N-acetyl-anhydromuramyl-L-alanine amidase AmpD
MTLLIDGQPYLTDRKVKHDIAFKPGMQNTTRQTAPWHGFGIHWTGAENSSDRVIRTLLARGLSVQFIVEKDGTIVQTADLTTKCAHIGAGNGRFIGVETVCRGFATRDDLLKAKLEDPTLRDRDELDWSEPRDTYTDTIGDKKVNLASFGPQQIESLIWLSMTLSERFGFPRIVPHRKVTDDDIVSEMKRSPLPNIEKYVITHHGSLWLPSFDRKPARFMSRSSNYRGVLGHLHVHKTKCDPGTEVFYKLWAAGFNPAGHKIVGV